MQLHAGSPAEIARHPPTPSEAQFKATTEARKVPAHVDDQEPGNRRGQGHRKGTGWSSESGRGLLQLVPDTPAPARPQHS